MSGRYPATPDGRYFLANGRLWRMTNPALREDERERLIDMMIDASLAARERGSDIRAIRAAIDAAQVALGERGPVWWDDGAPDFNCHLVKNTPYADWATGLKKPSRKT